MMWMTEIMEGGTSELGGMSLGRKAGFYEEVHCWWDPGAHWECTAAVWEILLLKRSFRVVLHVSRVPEMAGVPGPEFCPPDSANCGWF